MKTRQTKITYIIFTLGLVFFASFPVFGKYSGGSGTKDDPYQIATAEDLMLLGETPGDYDKHFIMIADIDMDPNLPGGKVFDKAVIAPDTSDANWLFDGTSFTGVFDGKGHTISHLAVVGTWYLGLFGRLESGSEVEDLGIVGACIAGSRFYIGGLAGVNYGGSVTYCYSSGTINGDEYVGGLLGGNSGIVTNCYSTSMVSGNTFVGGVGGLVGVNLVPHDEIPGLGAHYMLGRIARCYSTGAVRGGVYVGGLLGSGSPEHEDVTACFWDMQASGQATSAGGTGKTTAEMQTASTFIEAGWDFVGETANGPKDIWKIVEGQTYPLLSWQKYGGGTGEANDPYLIYTAEHLNALGAEPNDHDKHFKLMADIDLSGYTHDRAVIAFDTNDMEDGFQGTPFSGVFDGNGRTIAHLTIVSGSYVGLFGQLGEEWLSGGEVKNLGIVDVNITGSGDCVGGLVARNEGSIATSHCTGTVIGSGRSVGGLVGENNGFITSSFSHITVIGDYSVGGLVGTNGSIHGEGSVIYCYSTGTVNGSYRVGGLVGRNGYVGIEETSLTIYPPKIVQYYGTISNCYATADVDGKESVGGLVGCNVGSITTSYINGKVSGDDSIGGLVGKNGYLEVIATIDWFGEWSTRYEYFDGIVSECYSVADIVDKQGVGGLIGMNVSGPITNSFWDIEVSSQMKSDGGTGLTTAEMQTAATFLEAGWDFVDETANGTEDIWWIVEGKDYPRLWWERPLFIIVDDFESYNDIPDGEPGSKLIYMTWIDGFYNPEINGCTIGEVTGVSMEIPPITHSGSYSMPFYYNNSRQAHYSEATASTAKLEIDRDWTKNGVQTLSLWFYGNPYNVLDQMYVALANDGGPTGTIFYDDLKVILSETWTEWTIPLKEFSKQGVVLTNIDTISIGFGDKNNPKSGGSGKMYFDDIRLYRL